MNNRKNTLSYESAGVSIQAGDSWVDTIKQLAKKHARRLEDTEQKRVKGSIGGFAGLIDIGGGRCLAACCDGVGTKVEIARTAAIPELYRGLGQDLVAMNVNDLITCGARPLFFLDYLACGKLNVPLFGEVMEGIILACAESYAVLLGGETAEMPGVYEETGLDLAGFSVGLVETDKIINGSKIQKGDLMIGLPSSGLHSNGFSLVRKALLSKEGLSLDLHKPIEKTGPSLAELLLKPTKLYVRQVLSALEHFEIRGMAHITGGGLEANCGRILPKGLSLKVNYNAWKRAPIFDLIASAGVEEAEMRRVFNIGIGFVCIASPEQTPSILQHLKAMGEEALVIGEVI